MIIQRPARFSLVRARKGWFLVPVFAPFLGTIIGVMIYQLMVGFHVEGEERDKNKTSAELENVRLTNVTANNDNAKNGKETN